MPKFILLLLVLGLTLTSAPAAHAQSIEDLLEQIRRHQNTNNEMLRYDDLIRENLEAEGRNTGQAIADVEIREIIQENARLDQLAARLRDIRSGRIPISELPATRQAVNSALGNPPQQSAAQALLQEADRVRLPRNSPPRSRPATQQPPPTRPTATAQTIQQQVAQVDALAAARASAARTNLARNTGRFGNGAFWLIILHGIASTTQGGFLTYAEIADRVAGYRRILADTQLLADAQAAAARGDHSLMETRNRISAELLSLEAEKRAMEEKERERIRNMTQRQIENELINTEWERRNGT